MTVQVIDAEILDSYSPIGERLPLGETAIQPYTGYATPAPRPVSVSVGGSTPAISHIDEIASQTYVSASGTKHWLPTASESALIDTVTKNPYSGLDELVEAGGHTVSRGSKAFHALPYAGDVVGGVIEGAIVYSSTGSVLHGASAGVGATIGGIAGSAIGGAIGSFGGPVGTAAGAIVGGVIGGELGSWAGQAFANWLDPLPDENLNGVEVEGYTTFDPLGGGDFSAMGGMTIRYYSTRYNKTMTRMGQAYSTDNVYNTNPDYPDYMVGVVNSFTFCDGFISTSNDFFEVGPYGRTFTVISTGGCLGQENPFDPTKYPTREPYKTKDNPNTRDPVEEPNPLPQPKIPTIKLPSLPKIPNPIPGPTIDPDNKDYPKPNPDPTEEPDPIIIPVIPPFPDLPDGDDKDKDPDYPHPDPYPDPSDKTDPIDEPPIDEDDEECNPCQKLDEIINLINSKLDIPVSTNWEYLECGEDYPINRTGSNAGVGINGLALKLDALYQGLRVIHDNTRCDSSAEVVIPDSWEIKKELNTPQLKIVTKIPGDTTSYRRSFCVPHPRITTEDAIRAIFPSRIRYIRGKHLTMLTLKDNSDVRLFVESKTEGHRMMNIIIDSLLDPSYIDEEIRDSENANRKNGEIIEVELYTVHYYSKGKKGDIPDWIYKIPE
jgi:hypothetical protein